MIISSSDNAEFQWTYKNYKYFISVETNDIIILTATHNMIYFERPMQEFDTLFDYTFQEGPKLNLLHIKIIKN